MKTAELRALLLADMARLTLPDKHAAADDAKAKWPKLFSPRFTPVLLLRLARFCLLSRWLRPFSPLFTWSNVILFGIEVTSRCEIGPGLMLPHTHGTVIGATRIGRGVTIFQGVTLGAKFADLAFDIAARPTVGDEVMIGAGAKVLGGVHLGDKCVVAANSLVTTSVPDEAYAIGVPATVKHKN